jgi:hypothetical protein
LASVTITCQITKNEFPRIARGLAPGADHLLGKGAYDIQAHWAGDVRVDTGLYKGSIQVYHLGLMLWLIASNVNYALYNEFGSVTISARPSARAAAELVFPAIKAALRELVAA